VAKAAAEKVAIAEKLKSRG